MANHIGFAEEMREMWALITRPEVAFLYVGAIDAPPAWN